MLFLTNGTVESSPKFEFTYFDADVFGFGRNRMEEGKVVWHSRYRSEGSRPIVFDIEGIKFGAVVCYDAHTRKLVGGITLVPAAGLAKKHVKKAITPGVESIIVNDSALTPSVYHAARKLYGRRFSIDCSDKPLQLFSGGTEICASMPSYE